MFVSELKSLMKDHYFGEFNKSLLEPRSRAHFMTQAIYKAETEESIILFIVHCVNHLIALVWF